MESSATAKASSYLDSYPNAVIPRSKYDKDVDQCRGLPVFPTSFSLSTSSRGAVLRT